MYKLEVLLLVGTNLVPRSYIWLPPPPPRPAQPRPGSGSETWLSSPGILRPTTPGQHSALQRNTVVLLCVEIRDSVVVYTVYYTV